jgi:V/A-type H+-transporting ATPase subunit D
MATLKLTKNELRDQQKRLTLFQKYLPSLQLKKARLQSEVDKATLEVIALKSDFSSSKSAVSNFSSLLLNKIEVDILQFAEISYVKKHYENVAGVEIPIFEDVIFHDLDYFLFDTPIWTDIAIRKVRSLIITREKLAIGQEKKRALEKELRDVSIRVNLFEKILIPRALESIKKIKIFLGDQQLASVAQAKIAKMKMKKKVEEMG